jgi:hypothetical protein
MKKHAIETISSLVKRMKKIVIVILSILTWTMNLSAQDHSFNYYDCLIRLKNAETLYQNGLFINCIEMLEAALDSCDLTRKEKQQALELLAKSYVETDEMDKADATVNLLLKKFPHYELIGSKNPEMYNRLVKKYKVHPLITIGVKNTANWLQKKTTGVYTVLDGLDYSRPQPEAPYWFTYYGMAEYEFIDGISANIDLMFFLSSYRRDITAEPTFNLTYIEHDGFIEFPVYLKKYFHLGKNLLAYASGGAGLIYMWKARGTVTLSYTTQDVITGKNADFTGNMEDINYLDMKNRATAQWNAGVGIGYKVKNLGLFLDARYLGEIGSFTAPEKSDLFPELKNDYFYIDQKMKLTQFELGATISYTLFNSVKRMKK